MKRPMIDIGKRVRLTAKGKRWFCGDDAPEHVLATIVGHLPNETNCYELEFDDPEYGSLFPYADKTDIELWIEQNNQLLEEH